MRSTGLVASVLTLITLFLCGCAPLGASRISEQDQQQSDQDMLSTEDAQSVRELGIASDSTRLLGDSDGRIFYVGSAAEQICLVVIDIDEVYGSCVPQLPILTSAPGSFEAELWQDRPADHAKDGQWIGSHLWVKVG